MGENRIQEFLRDPTLESPAPDYFEVRLPWCALAVRRETAERIVEALLARDSSRWFRVETVTGSVVVLRAEDVIYVREWSRGQRASERHFWKKIDEEDENDEFD